MSRYKKYLQVDDRGPFAFRIYLSNRNKILLELRKVLLIQTRVMADDPAATRDDLARKLEEVKHLNYLVYEKVPL